jgi:hypothetical protein
MSGRTRYEREVVQKCLDLGAVVLARGWPDLLVQTDDGMIQGLEIKSASDRLSTEQIAMHEMLELAGLPVYVVNEVDPLSPALPRQTRLEHSIYRSSSGKIEIKMRGIGGRYVSEVQVDLAAARRRRDEIIKERATSRDRGRYEWGQNR